jgi:hypothetical protein
MKIGGAARVGCSMMRWTPLVLLLGCGSVSMVVAVDADPEVSTGNQSSYDGGEQAPVGTMVPVLDAGAEVKPEVSAPTCAAYTSPPYCASCRDSRGVCRCGALPCCDQHCQS